MSLTNLSSTKSPAAVVCRRTRFIVDPHNNAVDTVESGSESIQLLELAVTITGCRHTAKTRALNGSAAASSRRKEQGEK